MANEITITTAADLFASEVLAGEVQMLIADNDPSILNHPALQKITAPAGSNVIKVPLLGLNGSQLLAAHTAGTDIVNTEMVDDKVTIQLINRVKAYELDAVAAYAAQGVLGANAFAVDLVKTKAQTLIQLIAAAGAGFTATAGTTGVALTWASMTDAKGLLAAEGATGDMCCILSPAQWTQLERDSGNMGFSLALGNVGVVNTALGSYKGRWQGIDFYTSTHVPLANADADRAGSLFVRGGLAWGDAAFVNDGDPDMVTFGNSRLQRYRRPNRQSVQYIFSHMCGVSLGQQKGGAKIISVK